ncbi:UPF0721 transmembrane protein [Marmoricola endophyticus]|uniref:Probable membrane transporter protein n=1 Tax=Marmoricola endophyticus TaxID=2040280 RepID=A0A917BDZ0_9ACTN|nr:sulfite exporter TauE/SafE family protein [Marmoricola endophyticus]GGF34011.1 UPF0721 transmembrane protein [Marmoricola endophyticus]
MISSALEAVAVLLAGVAAGTINAVVGSGTLVTFPVLLAAGLPPVTANVSNNLGLVPGSLSAVLGHRRELVGQGRRVLRYGIASLLGSVLGALLLLRLPAGAFDAVVPVLVGVGVLLVILGPPLQRRVARRKAERGGTGHENPWWLWPAVLGTGVYGGYFGAAQGVILLAMLGIGIADTVQRLNGVKNALALVANAVAAVVFLVVAEEIDWWAVLVIAVGSAIGAQLGSVVARRLPPVVFRAVIVAVGVVAIVVLLVT